jgi:hypothetical protein
MNPDPNPDPFFRFSPVEYELRRQLAHATALELRRQSIEDFWRGSDELLATAATRARRAAERLLHRLRRRRTATTGPSV